MHELSDLPFLDRDDFIFEISVNNKCEINASIDEKDELSIFALDDQDYEVDVKHSIAECAFIIAPLAEAHIDRHEEKVIDL